MDEKALRGHVNASGFPFQLRVEHEIRQTTQVHSWEVVGGEYPWRHPETGREGFADLVLARGRMLIVIECKRLREQGTYIFLQPTDRAEANSEFRGCVTKLTPGGVMEIGWEDMTFAPASPESGYCVVPGTEAKDKPLLERLAAELIAAAEAVGWDQANMRRQTGGGANVWFPIPLIVTNAELVVCRYAPEQVSLVDGLLAAEGGDFRVVPFLRFRKGFAPGKSPPRSSLRELAQARERTVLVANAGALVEFLREGTLNVPDDFVRSLWGTS